jgi:5S rRNA maturation endonuclease (ribonuclease M5)
LRTDRWFCNTHKCHDTDGGNLEGFVVGLAHQHGDFPQIPRFRNALTWLRANAEKLQTRFANWPTMKCGSSSRRKEGKRFFPTEMRDFMYLLSIPSPYFLSRGFSAEILTKYNIGEPIRSRERRFSFGTGTAIVPIQNLDAPIFAAGYAARVMTDLGPFRWRLSSHLESKHRLFNYYYAEAANLRTGQLILVEGVPDALRCIEAGFPQTIALLGSYLLQDQFERLRQWSRYLDEIIVVRDNDVAGEKLARQVEKQFASLAGVVKVVHPPTRVKDIGELTTPEAHDLLMNTVGQRSIVYPRVLPGEEYNPVFDTPRIPPDYQPPW